MKHGEPRKAARSSLLQSKKRPTYGPMIFLSWIFMANLDTLQKKNFAGERKQPHTERLFRISLYPSSWLT